MITLREDELISELERIRYLANNGKIQNVSYKLHVLTRRILKDGISKI